jgi:hypothetical protein
MGDIFGGGNDTQTVTNQTVIPPFLEGALRGSISGAGQLFDAGSGFNAYPGATFVPPTANELQGVSQMEGIANAGNPLLDPTLQQFQQMLSSGGINPMQGDVLSQLQKIMSGDINIGGLGDYTSAIAQAQQPTAANNYLTSTARGDFLGTGNPYVGANLQTSADQASNRVNEMMAGMGRAGSPAHTETMMREIGDLYSRGLGQNYENERGRQMQATGLIDNAGFQQGQMLHNLLAGRGNLEGANIANMAGAGGSIFDAIGQGQDRALQYGLAAPGISEFRYQDPSKLVDIGAAQRGDLQSELQSFIDKFQTEDMSLWNRLGMAGNVIHGSSEPFYSQQETRPVDNGSDFARLLGGAGTLFSGLGSLGLFG